jgi:hypothetical protein
MLGDFHQIYHEHISIYPFMLNSPFSGDCHQVACQDVLAACACDNTGRTDWEGRALDANVQYTH